MTIAKSDDPNALSYQKTILASRGADSVSGVRSRECGLREGRCGLLLPVVHDRGTAGAASLRRAAPPWLLAAWIRASKHPGDRHGGRDLLRAFAIRLRQESSHRYPRPAS